MGENLSQPPQLRSQGRRSPLGRRFRHQAIEQRRHRQGRQPQEQEQLPPVEELQSGLHRQGRTKGTQPTGGHLHAVDQGEAVGRIPEHKGLEGGHQASGHPQTDQGPADHQAGQGLGQGEDQGAGGSHHQQRRLHPAGAIAVQEHPQRQLKQGKAQEVGGGQQAETGGGQLQFGDQLGGEHGIDGAKNVGKKVPQAKRDGDSQYNLATGQHGMPRGALPQRYIKGGRKTAGRLATTGRRRQSGSGDTDRCG